MKLTRRIGLTASVLLIAMTGAGTAFAQKTGGILRVYLTASPPTMSMLELPTIVGEMPMMGVFNNLIMFDQHVPQNSLQSIVPDLATDWSWSEDGTELTFKLRHGVKWHDGKPFTAADVKCTWDLMADKAADKLRLNPRKSSYDNLEAVTPNGDYEVTFRSETASAGLPDAARRRVFGDLSVPRIGGADAPASDRHRPIQIRRVQAQRVDQGDAEPGLLETRAPLSRRHRIYDHRRPFDGEAGI